MLESMNDESRCEGSPGEEDQHNEQDRLSEALNQIQEACEVFKREAEKLRQEREAIATLSKKAEKFHFSSTVKLNVGGEIFETSLQTLTKDPNSMLAVMFSGKFNMKPTEDGTFFIDRDGTYFRFILNFLRTGTLTLPEDTVVYEEVMKEAKFYQIQQLIDVLESPCDPTHSSKLGCKVTPLFGESVILKTEEHQNALREFLPSGCEKWRLLFRASRDGFKAQNFHSKCDHEGPTVTIVKSGDNIFGGFTENSWTSGLLLGLAEHFKRSTQSFLFSLVSPSGIGPTKMPLWNGSEDSGIVGYSSYGPTFGIRGDLFLFPCRDLFISNNADKNTESHSEVGTSYECPPGQESSFLTGGTYFTVSNYEVFVFH